MDYRATTRRLAEEGDFVGIAAKKMNVLFDPFDRESLIV